MQTNQNTSERGFNLIELSIVIVIISTLVASVIIGSELMNSGKVSAAIAEMAYYRNAQNEFFERYKYRPGDVPSSYMAEFFAGNAAETSCVTTANLGNNVWDDVHEEDLAWLQLSYTDFIKQKIDFVFT